MIFYDIKTKEEVILTTDEGTIHSEIDSKNPISYQIFKKDGRFVLRSKDDYLGFYYPSKNKTENFHENEKFLIGTKTILIDDCGNFSLYSCNPIAIKKQDECYSWPDKKQNSKMYLLEIDKLEKQKTIIIGSSEDCDLMIEYSKDCKIFFVKEEKTSYLEIIDPNCEFYYTVFILC